MYKWFNYFIIIFILGCGKSPLLMKKAPELEKSEHSGVNTLQTTQFDFNLFWLGYTNSNIEATALLLVKKDNLPTDLPLNFKIFLWMPEMGHGSSPIKIRKIETGLYELSHIYFIMDGLWQLRILLNQEDNHSEEQIFEISIK